MLNLPKPTLTDEQLRFINDLASLLQAWTMPLNAARLYGYLQIMNDPVSLDDIARDLEISKSNACTAAKVLEQHRNARRIGERGTKRIFYVAGDDPGAPLRHQTASLGLMSELISSRRNTVAEGAAATRMARLADFHATLRDAMEAVILPPAQSDAA